MKKTQYILGSLLGFALLVAGPAAAFAASGSSAGLGLKAHVAVGTTSAARVQNMQTRGAAEIDKRVASLQELITRISAMTKLTADQKTSIVSTLNAEISTLNTLKTEIASATASTTLKTDLQSITKGNRVFMLVIPQAEIMAAADRINEVASQMSAVITKVTPRIGTNASAQASLSDMQAKVADVSVQTQAAVSLVVNLKPDNGDKTVQASNQAALKSARTRLDAARQDLAAARHDLAQIISALGGKSGAGLSNGTSTTSH